MSSEHIAIFPLSNVVLFPGVHTPLHLFEPRYRQLAEDVLAGDRRVGMVVVPPEHAAAMAGNPPVYPVGCAGVIQQSRRLPDGRYDIVLHGQWRFRMLSEPPAPAGRLYRVAEVERLDDPLPEGAEARIAELRARVEGQVTQLVAPGDPERAAQLGQELAAGAAAGQFANALCCALRFAPPEKQGLLEASSTLERLERLEGLLAFRLASRDSRAGGSGRLH